MALTGALSPVRIESNLRIGNGGTRGASRQRAAPVRRSLSTKAPPHHVPPWRPAPPPPQGSMRCWRCSRSRIRCSSARSRSAAATALLDTLEEIKADLLIGRVSEGRLNQLMALIGQARERGDARPGRAARRHRTAGPGRTGQARPLSRLVRRRPTRPTHKVITAPFGACPLQARQLYRPSLGRIGVESTNVVFGDP